MSPVYRWAIRTARTLHLYLTLGTLGLMLFFSVTGFMLNHEDWFTSPDPHERTAEAVVPTHLLREPDRLGVVELLRSRHGAVGAVDSFEAEEDSLRIEFKGPGRRTEVRIDRQSGEMRLLYQSRGAWGVLLDLHRGKNTGMGWSVLIDVTCASLVLVAATGLILFASLRGRGRHGVTVAVLGVLLAAAVFAIWVP